MKKDIALMAGVGFVVYGVSMIHLPAALIVGGLLVCIAVFVAR